jgi:transcriptional regulator of stress and heat shock response
LRIENVNDNDCVEVEFMARLSDLIEAFLKQLIADTDGCIEIQRNELANQFRCVPSQINYVIDTRFTNERGYYVESRRGGGGYIKIKQANITIPGNYLMHIISSMGDSLSQQSAEAFVNNFMDYDVISLREGLIIKAAISDKVVGVVSLPHRDIMRANMLKNILMSMLV